MLQKQKLSDQLAFRIMIVAIIVGICLGFTVLSTGAHDETEEEDRLEIPPERPAAEKAFVEAIAACVSPSPNPQSCGVERWSVKTGSDATAAQINLGSTTPVTVNDLHALPSPNPIPANSRVAPGETTQWVIHGTAMQYKLESDSDYHIVVQDGAGNTIVTEIPYPGASPACVATNSVFLPGIAGARCKWDGSGLPLPTGSFQTANVPVRVVGVGMFDFAHGQTGASPNQIEIHAILDLAFPKTVNTVTNAGNDVSTQVGDATLTFPVVTNQGTTTGSPIDPSASGTAPSGYSLVGPAVNLSTTAITAGTTGICVSVPYITDAAAFAKLTILHSESGTLIDRTTSVDPGQKTVCGSLPSLGKTVVAVGTNVGPTPTPTPTPSPTPTPTPVVRPQFDLDGDHRSDIGVYRPSQNAWYINGSTAGVSAYQFGAAGDVLVPADYTGDGRTDIAIWRPSTGNWFALRSEDSTLLFGGAFGQEGDIPVPGDFDGDGKADMSVYRPGAQSYWYLNRSRAGFNVVPFGLAEDKPSLGDFDGDGKTDIAVFRPSEGNWYRLDSSTGTFRAFHFGAAGDQIVPADYTGDGKTDIAVFRPSTSVWYVLKSEDTTFYGAGFGTAGDLPVPADYDGDGKVDISVYRPSEGYWYLMQSTSGFAAYQFGTAEDKPIENSYVY